MSLRSESEVLDALKMHFSKAAYAVLPGVAEATGGDACEDHPLSVLGVNR